LKPKARNPRGVRIDELFLDLPETVRRGSKAPHQTWRWFLLFEAIDAVLRAAEPLFPRASRQRAIEKAVTFVRERLNGQHGLGAIFPPMANSMMMFDVLGYPKDHPDVKMARASIDKLLVIKQEEAYCQPCLSPVWDTVLTCQTLLEVGSERAVTEAVRSLRWLEPLQVLDVVGDWGERRPHVRPGGWAFQYVNPYYVDLDDTAVVVMAMDRAAKLAKTDGRNSMMPSRAEESGSSACNAATADGLRSTLTTPATISTTSLSPIMARCSILRHPILPLDAFPCWPSSVRNRSPAR
jgi:squalene-hopene/tetraprenyl-beta-curcumene cyclase